MFLEGIVTYKAMSINGDSIVRAAGATLLKKEHLTMKVLSSGWKLSYIYSTNRDRGTTTKSVVMSSCMSEIT